MNSGGVLSTSRAATSWNCPQSTIRCCQVGSWVHEMLSINSPHRLAEVRHFMVWNHPRARLSPRQNTGLRNVPTYQRIQSHRPAEAPSSKPPGRQSKREIHSWASCRLLQVIASRWARLGRRVSRRRCGRTGQRVGLARAPVCRPKACVWSAFHFHTPRGRGGGDRQLEGLVVWWRRPYSERANSPSYWTRGWRQMRVRAGKSVGLRRAGEGRGVRLH
jgi:hypothetical protein